MVRCVLGCLVATVAVFVFGALYWMFNPMAEAAMSQADDDRAVQACLRDTLGGSGIYMIPGMGEGQQAFEERHEEGPIAVLNYVSEGRPAMPPTTLLVDMARVLVMVVLAALLLLWAWPALESYGARVGFVVLAGAAGSVFTRGADAIWWMLPWKYAGVMIVYEVLAWLVAGLVLAALLKPNRGGVS